MPREFLSNEDAISEEFTSLPALSVVMIGFTLFLVLLANTYGAYYDRMDSLEIYQTADLLATKLINTNTCFLQAGGIANIPQIQGRIFDDAVNETRQQYQQSGLDFTLILSYDEYSITFPIPIPTEINRVAVSRDIAVFLNDAETIPGKLTIVMWKV